MKRRLPFLTILVVTTLGFATITLSLRNTKLKNDAAELDHCKVQLAAAETDNLAWENECLDVWDELIFEREQMDRCRMGEEICHDYCLCPWTLQPLLPGHEYDKPKYD